ncbi:cellulase family glycosylhydrolase [Patescibacteria group bacterium]|nr:cellulase family glycosylhydrolase [Patescibacteria group bacterium]
MKSFSRILIVFLILLVIFLIGIAIYFFTGEVELAPEVAFGVTFSQIWAEDMGLDWQSTYSAILDDLGVNKLRLIAYWPIIEPKKNEYSFDDLDWQIREADKRGAEVVLAIGQKLPRWPECHIPEWAERLNNSDREQQILLMITEIVNRYQGNDAIVAWQVENEPFLKGFGVCPEFDEGFLDNEIALVRELDFDRRPIIVSASGELSSWTKPARKANILGTTLYRIVWDDRIGHFKYPIPPIFYYNRANYVKRFTDVEKIIIIELQAEPWGPKMIYETSIKDQDKSMDFQRFNEAVEYVRQTGFDEAYLWGVEWWYWNKEVRGNNAIWAEAKKLWP